jgi:Ca2+-binding EF-hand superfamily protein
MRHTLLAGLVLASAGLAPTASAQQPEMVIGFLDKNGDGKCDLNEYLGFQISRISLVDKNGDGELNQAEFKETLQGKAKANAAMMFQGANTEGGRTLSQKEFLGYNVWVFKTFVDTDKDGFMSQEEWTAIMNKAG